MPDNQFYPRGYSERNFTEHSSSPPPPDQAGAHLGERQLLHPATREDVELYIRTYNTLLRSSGPIRLRSLIPAHVSTDSSLHPKSASSEPDMSAFIYSTLRLPDCISDVNLVLFGQSSEVFSRWGYTDIQSWTVVDAQARRRWWFYDGKETLAVEIGSTSDVDDLVPILVAFQIEWNKIYALLRSDHGLIEELRHFVEAPTAFDSEGPPIDGSIPNQLAERIRIRLRLETSDWERLESLFGIRLTSSLLLMAENEKQFTIRMLGGTHIGYARATRRWWRPVETQLRRHNLEGRPVYFISSNTHSLVNLLSGFAARRRDLIEERIVQSKDPEILPELTKLQGGEIRGSFENLLYYSARKLLLNAPDGQGYRVQRNHEEVERGIFTIPSQQGMRVDVQVIDLSLLKPTDFDPRISLPNQERLRESEAIIVNIDYPLGLAAYHILLQIAQSVDDFRGIYILGKAATLNGSVGDVMISDVIYDEHSGNTYWLDNCFSATDISDNLVFGSVLDHQKAVAVKGTFLQNRQHLEFYYRESFTVVEMEAGPYLSALYEYFFPTRHPTDENISFSRLPVEVGLMHYASDTPYSRGKNLLARRMSFFGMDSAYAGSVAILRRILAHEIDRIETGLSVGPLTAAGDARGARV